MASFQQSVYWRAPYFLKNWMASINARKLDKWRFGKYFEQTCDELKERENWTQEQFTKYQATQLSAMVQHAAANVPYYRNLFAEKGIDPVSIKTPNDLKRIPILGKETVRQDPGNFVDETLDISKLYCGHTSGTTGTPLKIYRDHRLYSLAFAYGEMRWHAVAGMQRRINPSVSIGGHLVTSPKRNKSPFWVVNRHWKQLYMSSYHLAPDYLKFYVGKLRSFGADYIEGIPSSVYFIARYITDNNLEPVPFAACFTTAETLFDYQREVIKEAFGCKTYDQYGCGEYAVFASECKNGAMHLSPEMGIVEVLDDKDQPVPAGVSGRLVCTSLVNQVQPFIRYRVGDVGSLATDLCSCGSQLPVLASIEGRDDDVLITKDGRSIGRLDPVFKGTSGIIQAQIIQEDYHKFRVLIVPSRDYKEQDARNIRQRLLERIGSGEIEIQLVDRIAKTSAGKFRAVVNKIPK